MKKLKVLTFSSLYPNAFRQGHGVFTEHRLRHLLSTGRIETRVVAPVPWVPPLIRGSALYKDHTRTPSSDRRHGIDILYPRYPVIPKVGMTLAPFLMAAALVGPLQRLVRQGFNFDVLDAFYFYPDGVAAAILGRLLNKPVVITAFGSDISLISKFLAPRRWIRWAARHADGMTTVCQALKDALVDLGAPAQKIHVVLHGVDQDLFAPPPDREALRAKLGLTRPTLLSVGSLIELKGHHIVIEAMSNLPDMDLLIAGRGAMEGVLRQQVERLGLAGRVRFLGQIAQDELSSYFGAADALVLASSREGIANVLLESMACGTPVIATQVWGTPEVVTAPEAGVMMTERTPAALIAAQSALFKAYPERAATRRFAERFSWSDTAAQHLAVLEEAVARHGVSG